MIDQKISFKHVSHIFVLEIVFVVPDKKDALKHFSRFGLLERLLSGIIIEADLYHSRKQKMAQSHSEFFCLLYQSEKDDPPQYSAAWHAIH